MVKKINILLMILVSAQVLLLGTIRAARVAIEYNHQVIIPEQTKNIGLIGCTPHPTKYLSMHTHYKGMFKDVPLSAIIDLNDLSDSYEHMFQICKDQNIDLLVVAYLPIYFYRLKASLGNLVSQIAQEFFESYVPQLYELIQKSAQKTGYNFPVIICVPPANLFKDIPNAVDSFREEYACYLIKQFPRLVYREQLSNPTITIINNTDSDEQNQTIIQLLRYEYLYQARPQFCVVPTGKERFHLYCSS